MRWLEVEDGWGSAFSPGPRGRAGGAGAGPHRGGGPRGFGGANTAQTPAGKRWLHADLGEGSLPRVGGLWSLSPYQQAGFFLLPCRQEAPIAIAQLFLPCLGSRLYPACKFPRVSWAPSSPPCYIWDLYLILIYCFIGLFLSLLLFLARLSSRFALQRAAGWL